MASSLANLLGLPYESWLDIGQWLPPSTLLKIGPTCHLFYQLSHDNGLWRLFFTNVYAHHSSIPGIPFRQQYLEAGRLITNLKNGIYTQRQLDPQPVQFSYGIFLFEGYQDGNIRKYERDEGGTYQLKKEVNIYKQSIETIYFNHGYLFIKYSGGKIGIFDDKMTLLQLFLPPVKQPWHLKIEEFDGNSLLINYGYFFEVWNINSKGLFELTQTIEKPYRKRIGCSYFFIVKNSVPRSETRGVSILKRKDEDGKYYESQCLKPILGLKSIEVAADLLFLFVYQNSHNMLFVTGGTYIAGNFDGNFNFNLEILRKNPNDDTYNEIQTIDTSEDLIYYSIKHKDLFVFSSDKSLEIYTEKSDGTFIPLQNLGKNLTLVYFDKNSDYFITQFKEVKTQVWKKEKTGMYQEYSLEVHTPEDYPLVSLTLGDEDIPMEADIITKNLSMIGPLLFATSYLKSRNRTMFKIWENDEQARTFKKIQGFYIPSTCFENHSWQRNNLVLKTVSKDSRVVNMVASPLAVLSDIGYSFMRKERFQEEKLQELIDRFLRLPKKLLEKLPPKIIEEISKAKSEEALSPEQIGALIINYLKKPPSNHA